jgi:hypothetical protein
MSYRGLTHPLKNACPQCVRNRDGGSIPLFREMETAPHCAAEPPHGLRASIKVDRCKQLSAIFMRHLMSGYFFLGRAVPSTLAQISPQRACFIR